MAFFKITSIYLNGEYTDVEVLVDKLEKVIEEKETHIEELEKRIEELENQLG